MTEIRRWLFATLFMLSSMAFATIERVTYFVNDANGSPLLEINDAGMVIAEAEYRPYGDQQEAIRRTGPERTIGYAGSLNQQDGIQAMGVRLYAPELGRFISPDPVECLHKGANHFGRYHYANNNPHRYLDADGREAIAVAWVDHRVPILGVRWSYTGHAGVVLVNPDFGAARFYDYGRFPGVGDVVIGHDLSSRVLIQDGMPTGLSMSQIVREISDWRPYQGAIEGAYFPEANYTAMSRYAGALSLKRPDQGGLW